MDKENVTEHSNQDDQDLVYFISYYSDRKREMGNTEAVLSGEISSIEEVKELEKMIAQSYGLNGITIINFFPLRFDNLNSDANAKGE